VVVALFPDSNLQTAKRRPVLVIQADNLNTGIGQTVVALITSNMTRAGHPCRVSVSVTTPEGRQAGLRQDSVIMLDNIATLLDRYLERKIGTWSDMAVIDAALRRTLSL
jgi:mRNA interferase MazF